MTLTPLDEAHAAMEAAPEDEAARLRFWDRLAASELFVFLTAEARGDAITPETVTVEGSGYVLAFDTEARLADFAGGAAPYAALSGRALAGMLAPAGLGLALNPEAAPSATLLPPDAMAWLSEALAATPQETSERPVALAPPTDLPGRFLEALDGRLAAAAGLAREAWLASATYVDGRSRPLLAFVAIRPGAEEALGETAAAALAFSGLGAGDLDLVFLAADSALAGRLARIGLRFDLPVEETAPAPTAPGSDPDRPPRLR